MTTFFLIAGFFAHMIFHRKGIRGFARARGKRILLPFIVGWFVLVPFVLGALWWAWTLSPVAIALPARRPGTFAFPLIHLWFLYLLIWM